MYVGMYVGRYVCRYVCMCGYGIYENITLRNIEVNNPTYNAGVLMGMPGMYVCMYVYTYACM
jgi:hypothetical protein